MREIVYPMTRREVRTVWWVVSVVVGLLTVAVALLLITGG